jgi:hypothetical protein
LSTSKSTGILGKYNHTPKKHLQIETIDSERDIVPNIIGYAHKGDFDFIFIEGWRRVC